jgi:hypothetical protein
MCKHELRKVSQNTVVLFREDDSGEVAHLLPSPLVEARYLYVPVPFRATHMLTVNICIVPFSIARHRGQLFYHVEAFYIQCCQGLNKSDFMPVIASMAQRVYSIYMSHHTWNFNLADSWLVSLILVIIFRPSLTVSNRQQVQVPQAVLQQGSTCSERSTLVLDHLLDLPEASSGLGEAHGSTRFQTAPDFCYEQHSSSDEGQKRTSDAISNEHSIKHSVSDNGAQNKTECTIATVATRFLAGFRNTNFSGIATELRGSHPSNTDVLVNRRSEPATQAFKCCKSIAVQAKQQLKYATFTRFVSLCFFLIWEALACKPGKAGAREVRSLNES